MTTSPARMTSISKEEESRLVSMTGGFTRVSFANVYCAALGAIGVGVVLHTLLIRAPQAQATLDAMVLVMEEWDESLASSSPDELPLPSDWRGADGPYVLVSEDSMHLCKRRADNSWVTIDIQRALERLKES